LKSAPGIRSRSAQWDFLSQLWSRPFSTHLSDEISLAYSFPNGGVHLPAKNYHLKTLPTIMEQGSPLLPLLPATTPSTAGFEGTQSLLAPDPVTSGRGITPYYVFPPWCGQKPSAALDEDSDVSYPNRTRGQVPPPCFLVRSSLLLRNPLLVLVSRLFPPHPGLGLVCSSFREETPPVSHTELSEAPSSSFQLEIPPLLRS